MSPEQDNLILCWSQHNFSFVLEWWDFPPLSPFWLLYRPSVCSFTLPPLSASHLCPILVGIGICTQGWEEGRWKYKFSLHLLFSYFCPSSPLTPVMKWMQMKEERGKWCLICLLFFSFSACQIFPHSPSSLFSFLTLQYLLSPLECKIPR